MPIIASDKPSTPGIEAGSYAAICTAVIQLGSHKNDNYPDKAPQPKVALRWELPDERIDVEGKSVPRRMIKTYTLSLGKKAVLRKDLESWRGRPFTAEELVGFDLKNILSRGCMLSVTVNEKGKSVISGVSKLPKGMTSNGPEGDPIYWCLDECAGVLPDGLPEFIIMEIKKSPEWAEIEKKTKPQTSTTFVQGGGTGDNTEKVEDVPF